MRMNEGGSKFRFDSYFTNAVPCTKIPLPPTTPTQLITHHTTKWLSQCNSRSSPFRFSFSLGYPTFLSPWFCINKCKYRFIMNAFAWDVPFERVTAPAIAHMHSLATLRIPDLSKLSFYPNQHNNATTNSTPKHLEQSGGGRGEGGGGGMCEGSVQMLVSISLLLRRRIGVPCLQLNDNPWHWPLMNLIMRLLRPLSDSFPKHDSPWPFELPVSLHHVSTVHKR